jgi:DnaJ domain
MYRSFTVRTVHASCRRGYFTDGQKIHNDDPFKILGLEWGDGATSADIKAAFRKQAQKLHPDVNQTDSPEDALVKFQQLQRAYESLMKNVAGVNGDQHDLQQWRVALWRQSDRLALDRTDVAGVKRKRPAPPASASKSYARELGHPDGNGGALRGEYIGEAARRPSSVGTGQSKWVKPKEFKPWSPPETGATMPTSENVVWKK